MIYLLFTCDIIQLTLQLTELLVFCNFITTASNKFHRTEFNSKHKICRLTDTAASLCAHFMNFTGGKKKTINASPNGSAKQI